MIVEYYPRILYGQKYYYPISNDAKALCKLINRPTLTVKHLQICKEAGWKVKEKEQAK